MEAKKKVLSRGQPRDELVETQGNTHPPPLPSSLFNLRFCRRATLTLATHIHIHTRHDEHPTESFGQCTNTHTSTHTHNPPPLLFCRKQATPSSTTMAQVLDDDSPPQKIDGVPDAIKGIKHASGHVYGYAHVNKVFILFLSSLLSSCILVYIYFTDSTPLRSTATTRSCKRESSSSHRSWCAWSTRRSVWSSVSST